MIFPLLKRYDHFLSFYLKLFFCCHFIPNVSVHFIALNNFSFQIWFILNHSSPSGGEYKLSLVLWSFSLFSFAAWLINVLSWPLTSQVQITRTVDVATNTTFTHKNRVHILSEIKLHKSFSQHKPSSVGEAKGKPERAAHWCYSASYASLAHQPMIPKSTSRVWIRREEHMTKHWYVTCWNENRLGH